MYAPPGQITACHTESSHACRPACLPRRSAQMLAHRLGTPKAGSAGARRPLSLRPSASAPAGAVTAPFRPLAGMLLLPHGGRRAPDRFGAGLLELCSMGTEGGETTTTLYVEMLESPPDRATLEATLRDLVDRGLMSSWRGTYSGGQRNRWTGQTSHVVYEDDWWPVTDTGRAAIGLRPRAEAVQRSWVNPSSGAWRCRRSSLRGVPGACDTANRHFRTGTHGLLGRPLAGLVELGLSGQHYRLLQGSREWADCCQLGPQPPGWRAGRVRAAVQSGGLRPAVRPSEAALAPSVSRPTGGAWPRVRLAPFR